MNLDDLERLCEKESSNSICYVLSNFDWIRLKAVGKGRLYNVFRYKRVNSDCVCPL